MSETPTTSSTSSTSTTPSTPTHTYTLTQLVQLLGAPSDADRVLFAVTEDTATMQEMGAKMASNRILTDGERWLGQVYTAQKELAADTQPIPAALLRVTLAELQKLSAYQTNAKSDKATQEQARAVAITEAREARTSLLADRQKVLTLLRTAARGDATLLAAIESIVGTVETPVGLQVSVQQLLQLARTWIAVGGLAGQRLRVLRVTDAEIARIHEAAGAYVELQARADGARTALPVTQTEIDIQDGICLVLLTELYRLSKALRLQDLSVPALHPIALRSFFYN